MSHVVPNEILRQLGGNRFVVITGAKDFVGSKISLSMTLPHGAKGNRLKITLNGNDLYDLKLQNYRNLKLKDISLVSDVFVENLLDVFEAMTGLYTTLTVRK